MASSEVPILQQYLKKKGSKLGLWHKRFCILFGDRIIIRKKANREEGSKVIPITPDTEATLTDADLTISSPSMSPITLSSEEQDAVLNWAQHIRHITMMTPGMSIDDFEQISVIGRGFYGKVMLCKQKATGQYFAIKSVHKNRLVSSNKVHTIFTERNILMNSRHPFIINLCFAFQNESKVYLGLEYASGGELFYHLHHRGTLPLEEVKLYIAELSLALNYLHNKGVIYRDLKPENILLDRDGHVKLTDFGLSKILTITPKTKSFCGTSEYLAPEIVGRRPYGFEVDWWALGILTFELLFGKTPFYDENKGKMFESIRCDKYTCPEGTDPETEDFISILLKKNPNDRAGFEQIKTHPWFKGLDFEEVLMKKVTPSYIPPPSSRDAINVPEEFALENPEDSLGTPVSSTPFQGFSYVGGMDHDNDSSSGPSVDPSFLDDDIQPV